MYPDYYSRTITRLYKSHQKLFYFYSLSDYYYKNLIVEHQQSWSKMTSAAEQLTDFRIKLITYMNTKLDEECDIDDLEQLGESDDTNPNHPVSGQEFAIAGYKIIRIRGNICFIWTISSYFLVNLDTDLAHMRLFSTKTEGKLVKAVLGNQNSDDIAA